MTMALYRFAQLMAIVALAPGCATQLRQGALEFKKEGYVAQTVTIDPELNSHFWGNLLFGPL